MAIVRNLDKLYSNYLSIYPPNFSEQLKIEQIKFLVSLHGKRWTLGILSSFKNGFQAKVKMLLTFYLSPRNWNLKNIHSMPNKRKKSESSNSVLQWSSMRFFHEHFFKCLENINIYWNKMTVHNYLYLIRNFLCCWDIWTFWYSPILLCSAWRHRAQQKFHNAHF